MPGCFDGLGFVKASVLFKKHGVNIICYSKVSVWLKKVSYEWNNGESFCRITTSENLDKNLLPVTSFPAKQQHVYSFSCTWLSLVTQHFFLKDTGTLWLTIVLKSLWYSETPLNRTALGQEVMFGLKGIQVWRGYLYKNKLFFGTTGHDR